MRFRLVEALTGEEKAKIENSKHLAKAKKLADKNKGVERGSSKYTSNLMKSVEQNKKALDGIPKISSVKDAFASVLVNGTGSPSFQFICDLPDEAYQDRRKFEYFVKKLLNGELGVAKGDGSEGVGYTPIVSPRAKHSLYMLPMFWRSNEFNKVLDLYAKLNNESEAQRIFGNTELLKKNNGDGFMTYFVVFGANEEPQKMKSYSEIQRGIEESSKQARDEQAKAEREAKKMSVDDVAKGKEIPAYNMLLGLIKDYHGQLSTSKYASGKRSAKYYTVALKKLGDDLKAKASGEQLDEIGRNNADFLQRFLTTKRYSKVSPFKILSDFETAVDQAVAQEVIGVPVQQRTRPNARATEG